MILFERKHWQVLLGASLGLLLVGLFIYLLLLKPADQRIELLAIQNENIDMVEETQEEDVSISSTQIALLSQKVPLERDEESIILDLEKSALASDTRLESIVFEYDILLNEVPQEFESEDAGQGDDETVDPEGENQPLDPVLSIPVPAGLQSILVELSIQSKDYESMLLFIREMEKLNRVYTIETFAFTGFYEDEERVGPMEKMLTYSIQLVTYYAQGIDLPVDTDETTTSQESDKINPLQDVKEVDDSSTQDSVEVPVDDQEEPANEPEPAPQQPEMKTHVVRSGETLFSISMDYYGNRNGESIIMSANNKKSNTVYVGEVLQIP